MKILRIIARLNVGGPARHVIWLTEALSRDGFESVLVTGSVPDNEDSLEWFAADVGVTPLQVKEMSRELSFSDVRSFFRLLKIIFRERPDVIHTHTAKAGTLGRFAGLLYRFFSRKPIRIVHTYHGHVFHGYYGRFKTGLFIFIEKVLARIATDRIVTISELQRREINESFGVGKSSQFAVIPLGLDLEMIGNAEVKRNLKSELGFNEDAFLIGFSGRFTEIKNLKMLLRVVETLHSRGRKDFGLVMIGDGHLRNELEKESKSLMSGEFVRFIGVVDNPFEFIGALDCVALCSLNEGTPLSLLEAMAMGKAVVSTEVGGVPDILGSKISETDGVSIRENGLGVKSGDVEAFAGAVEMLMNNQELRRDIESRAKQFVEREYSKERLVSDIKQLYSGLFGRGA